VKSILSLYEANDQCDNYQQSKGLGLGWILPILSKVFEKIVYNRLINYIDRFHILIDNQYGFRSGRSTYLALLQLYNKISSAIDKNEFTIGIFLDLSKAFDTVSHDILFDKLQHYGIRGTALDWFKSYLYNRLQYVQYNGFFILIKLLYTVGYLKAQFYLRFFF
jgi:hypothetical protein